MKKKILLTLFLIAGTVSLFAQKGEVFTPSDQAIGGYDPVAYFKEGKPVKGNEKLSYQWEGANWYFSSKQNLDLFSKSPDQYVPQYGGYCAYAVSEGHKAPTDPNAWTIINGKLYLNYSLDVREKWSKNQKERIDQADENWTQLKDKE